VRISLLVAKGTVALLLGVAFGYAFGTSVAHDAAKGRALTMSEYVADFKHHKAELESQVPMWGALSVGVGFAFATFLSYEVLALGLSRIIIALDRRTSTTPDNELRST
jgi:amino acid transporter